MHCAKEFEKEKGIHFGYYCLISGQDYPIRNVSSIRDELQNSYPKPYIDCTPCAKGNWVYNGSSNSAWWNSVSAKINRWLPKPSLMRKLVKCPIFVANLLTSRQMNPRVLLEKKTHWFVWRFSVVGTSRYNGWLSAGDCSELQARQQILSFNGGGGAGGELLPNVADELFF